MLFLLCIETMFPHFFSSVRSRRLSVHLDEKLEFLENLVMKTNDLEQETEHLEDSLLYVIFLHQQ